jgi:hypothetical protein
VTGYQVGDEVRVFPLYGFADVPPAGWHAKVTAVRTGDMEVLLTEFPNAQPGFTITFSRADSRSTDSGGQYMVWPVDVAERKARRDAALAVLREYRIGVEPGSCLDTEQLEALAEVAKNWEG